jgi:hypothetical protein
MECEKVAEEDPELGSLLVPHLREEIEAVALAERSQMKVKNGSGADGEGSSGGPGMSPQEPPSSARLQPVRKGQRVVRGPAWNWGDQVSKSDVDVAS